MALLAVLLLQSAPAAVELTEATFEKWRDTIAAKPDELRWSRIPWRPTVAQTLADARAADRPAILWVMNGHPLADC
jgi:hypothetical protein